MSRTPEEVFAHHGQVLGAGDLDGILEDYSEDSLFIVQGEIHRGLDGARAVFTQLLSDVPNADWTLSTTFADDVLYLEWAASGEGFKVEDGVDTFVFVDGKIRVQTVVYHVQHP